MRTTTQKKVTGITQLSNGKWKATISAMGEYVYLGCHKSFDDALAARIKAESIVKKAYPDWKPGLRKDNASGTPGISFSKRDRKWYASKNGKFLGTFERLADAERAVADYMAGK